MLFRRRPLLRAGMFAGAAYAAHEAGERSTERRYAEADQDQRLAELESQAPSAPAAAPPSGAPLIAELTKLKDLMDAGALTPEEFTAAKQKLLAG